MSTLDIKVQRWNELSESEQRQQLARPQQSRSAELKSIVRDILSQVRNQGDDAVIRLTQQFDYPAAQSLALSSQQRAELIEHQSRTNIVLKVGDVWHLIAARNIIPKVITIDCLGEFSIGIGK